MTLPAHNDISGAGSDQLDLKTWLEGVRDELSKVIGQGGEETVVIASGSATPGARDHGSIFLLDTEGALPTDDLTAFGLTNINDKAFFVVKAANPARVVTMKHGASLSLLGAADWPLDDSAKWSIMRREGTGVVEYFRQCGADKATARNLIGVPQLPTGHKLCPHELLAIDYATAASLTVTATALVLTDSAGNQIRSTTWNATLTISGTGAGGRVAAENAGAEKASDWYHVWAIQKTDGTKALFASLAAFPGGASIYSLLPAGYVYAGYLGAVYNNASSNFEQFFQRGHIAHSSPTMAIAPGTSSSIASVSLAALVPDSATAVIGGIRARPASAGTQASVTLYPHTTLNLGSISFIWSSSGAVTNAAQFRLMLEQAQTIRYAVGAGDECDIEISGWEF